MSAYRFLPFDSMDIFRLGPSPSPNSEESCAIIGDDYSLKRSLLFQAALSVASAGDQVLFIGPRPLDRRPYHVMGLPEPSHVALQCIKMVYIENPSDLLQYLCEFHTKESFPAAIAIDDIQYYVSHLSHEINEIQNKEAALVKLFAILEDTTAFISEKKGEVCHRMVSISKGACPKSFLKRYFRELWYISSGEKEGEYFLTDCQVPALRTLFHLNDKEEIVFGKLLRLPSENENEAQWAMSQPLPVSDFEWVSTDQITEQQLCQHPDDDAIGYILEADLEYPPTLHDLHYVYPLAPEK